MRCRWAMSVLAFQAVVCCALKGQGLLIAQGIALGVGIRGNPRPERAKAVSNPCPKRAGLAPSPWQRPEVNPTTHIVHHNPHCIISKMLNIHP